MSTIAIYQSGRCRVALINPGRRGLVTTFDYWRHDRVKLAPVEKIEIVDELGLSQLLISTGRNDWYLNAELDEMMHAAELASRDFDLKINYGFSMGGFAAYLFAEATRPADIIAISPQYSIDPSICPFEKRWIREAEAIAVKGLDLRTRCSNEQRSTLIFDPDIQRDRRHARLFKSAFPKTRLVGLNGGGHPATRVLRKAEMVGDMCRHLLSGGDPSDVVGMHRDAMDLTSIQQREATHSP